MWRYARREHACARCGRTIHPCDLYYRGRSSAYCIDCRPIQEQ